MKTRKMSSRTAEARNPTRIVNRQDVSQCENNLFENNIATVGKLKFSHARKLRTSLIYENSGFEIRLVPKGNRNSSNLKRLYIDKHSRTS